MSEVQPTKRCSRCKEEKPSTSFCRSKQNADGLQGWCRFCHAAKRKEDYQKNLGTKKHEDALARMRGRGSEKRRWDSIRSSYGLEPEEYQQIFKQQDGRCGICRKPETMTRMGKVRNLCVDHSHTTGKVRSLLCQKCNSLIGLCDEDEGILFAAIEFLRIHRENGDTKN